jgi:hypothetical protein
MADGKDSAEVVKFLSLYSRLKDWCDDDPDAIFHLAVQRHHFLFHLKRLKCRQHFTTVSTAMQNRIREFSQAMKRRLVRTCRKNLYGRY